MKPKPNRTIHTVTFVDISYSWGPAIHFVELWNEYGKATGQEVTGYAVLERDAKPYTKPLFRLKALKIPGKAGRLARWLLKVLFDLILCLRFLYLEPAIIYIRESRFGILLLLALLLRNHRVFVEMNGLAAEDQMNRRSRRDLLRVAFYKFMERLHLKLPGVTAIAVAEKISQTIRKRYGIRQVFTVYNGCSSRLLRSRAHQDLEQKDALEIGFVGTFTPWDGHEKTGQFYRAVKKAGRKTRFHIAGPQVKKTALYAEFQDNRDFLFYDTIPYQELGAFYGKLDAAFSFDKIDRSKKVEQSTLKILEYWAAKLPILSTRARGNEFIEEHQLGYLIGEQAYEDPQGFQQAVAAFLESLNHYAASYENAPPPRTWRQVALETRKIIRQGFS